MAAATCCAAIPPPSLSIDDMRENMTRAQLSLGYTLQDKEEGTVAVMVMDSLPLHTQQDDQKIGNVLTTTDTLAHSTIKDDTDDNDKSTAVEATGKNQDGSTLTHQSVEREREDNRRGQFGVLKSSGLPSRLDGDTRATRKSLNSVKEKQSIEGEIKEAERKEEENPGENKDTVTVGARAGTGAGVGVKQKIANRRKRAPPSKQKQNSALGVGGNDTSVNVIDHVVSVRYCHTCGTTKTPQWREGPDGPKTLCNACGVKRNRDFNKQKQKSKHKSKKPRQIAMTDNVDDRKDEHMTRFKGKNDSGLGVPVTPLLYTSTAAAVAAAENAAAAATKVENDISFPRYSFTNHSSHNEITTKRVPRRASAQKSMATIAAAFGSSQHSMKNCTSMLCHNTNADRPMLTDLNDVSHTQRGRGPEIRDESLKFTTGKRKRRGSEKTNTTSTTYNSDTDIDELRPPSPPTTSPAKKTDTEHHRAHAIEVIQMHNSMKIKSLPSKEDTIGGAHPHLIGEENCTAYNCSALTKNGRRRSSVDDSITFDATTLLAMRHASEEPTEGVYMNEPLNKMSVSELEELASTLASETLAAEAAVNAVARVLSLKQAVMIVSREKHKMISAELSKAKRKMRKMSKLDTNLSSQKNAKAKHINNKATVNKR